MLQGIFKGFSKYRVSTYCPKHGVRINYFTSKELMQWAVVDNSRLWKLVKVQSRFLKRDIIKVEN